MRLQLLRFGLVGVAGYVVDSGILYACIAGGASPWSGRLVSFLCAVLVTWLLNRRFTFVPEKALQAQASVLKEGLQYLSAMLLGGLLNLLTFALIMQSWPHRPWLPAAAVGVGSLVGMFANFASAKWWVFRLRDTSKQPHIPWWTVELDRTDHLALAGLQLIFWFGHLHDMALPGLYMDAVNPDYMAAQALHPTISNAVFAMPTVLFPVLGSPYHGVQNFYVGLPVFALLGFNMLALRVAQGVFGAGIVTMTYMVIRRFSGSQWLALTTSAGLATELAFLASFRTQNYIVISGVFWLLLSIWVALAHFGDRTVAVGTESPSITSSVDQAGLRWSGFFAGLAVYSYFVFLFFVPALVLLGFYNTRQWRTVWTWCTGFALGMMTYVLGYTLLVIKLKGPVSALTWLKQTLTSLDPMASKMSMWASLTHGWGLLQLAIGNVSNEHMIFGTATDSIWPAMKLALFGLATILVLSANVWTRRFAFTNGPAPSFLHPCQLVWLLVSFYICATYFGSRLWGHHYSVLVPLLYLLLAFSLGTVGVLFRPSAARYLIAGVMALVLMGNLAQQQVFFARLEQTGGNGKFSDAINRMAEDALNLPPEIVHVFPEWGFMMSFAFLTGNQRKYLVDMPAEQINKLTNNGEPLRLYYWKAEDADKYRESLSQLGLTVGEAGEYLQRDQKAVFFWMQARKTP